MRVRKLLDWRKLLIYSHRWLGIVLGIVFMAWCVSGVVLMYYGVPHLTAGERLMRLPPLDLSAIRVTPVIVISQRHLPRPHPLPHPHAGRVLGPPIPHLARIIQER